MTSCSETCLYISFLICLLIIYSGYNTGNSNAFEQETPCLCSFGDGMQINLTDLVPRQSNDKFLSASMGNLTMYYHGCTDVKFGMEIEHITSTCTELLTLCLYNRTDHSLNKMGRAIDSKFERSQENPKLMEVAYQDKDSNITTLITLVCTMDSQENIFKMHSYNETVLEFNLFSPYGCKVERVVTGLEIFLVFLYGILIALAITIAIVLCFCCLIYLISKYSSDNQYDSDSD